MESNICKISGRKEHQPLLSGQVDSRRPAFPFPPSAPSHPPKGRNHSAAKWRGHPAGNGDEEGGGRRVEAELGFVMQAGYAPAKVDPVAEPFSRHYLS